MKVGAVQLYSWDSTVIQGYFAWNSLTCRFSASTASCVAPGSEHADRDGHGLVGGLAGAAVGDAVAAAVGAASLAAVGRRGDRGRCGGGRRRRARVAAGRAVVAAGNWSRNCRR